MSRGPDAHTLLGRALLAEAVAAGCPATLLRSDWKRWASATFTGARHQLVLSVPAGTSLERWIAALPDAEFTLRGHLVADLVIGEVRREGDLAELSLEALTVEER